MKRFEEIGHFWKESRKHAGLTQGQVARILSLESGQFISNCERGLCDFPLESAKVLLEKYRADKDQYIRIKLKESEKEYRTKLFN